MGTIGPFLWLWKNGGSDSGWGGGGGYDPFSLIGIPVVTDVFTPTQFVSGDTPNTYNGYSVSWKLLTQGGWQTVQLGDAFALFGASLSGGPSAGLAVLPPQSQGSQSRLACAANFGQNHSIAAAFGGQNNFVGNLLGGNSVSGILNLGMMAFGSKAPTGGDMASVILSGGGQGLPGGGPGFKGAAGMASDAIVGGAVSAGYNAITGVGQQTLELGITASGTVASVATPLAATTVGTIVGYANLAKLALDAGTFAYGAIFACHQ